MSMTADILRELSGSASLSRKKTNEWFFKTGPGEYGEGDIFIGVSVPDSRKIAKKYFRYIGLSQIKEMLTSEIHEVRLCALHMLVLKYEKIKSTNQKDLKNQKQEIFKFYISNLHGVNNWDLVDTSCSYIVGDYLYNFENKNFIFLKKLAKDKNLWKKRIGIISTFYFIKQRSDKEIYEIAEIVKNDKHDLIQKALGWMLRESYQRVNGGNLRKFLEKNIKDLPRTTLRYAIEKMDIYERKKWLSK